MLDSIYVEIERHTALASLIWVPLQASNWTAEVLDCRGVLLTAPGVLNERARNKLNRTFVTGLV